MTKEEEQLHYSNFAISIIEGVHSYINERLVEEPDKMKRALILNRVIGNISIGFYNMQINFTNENLIARDNQIQKKINKGSDNAEG